MKRALLLTLAFLSGCAVPVVTPNPPGSELAFTVCDDALELPTAYRAFQGLDGWFFFEYDLEATQPLLAQTDFMIELSRRLEAQGVTLVLLPVSSRPIVRPDTLYLSDPQQAAFSLAAADAAHLTFLSTLQAGGVAVLDAVAAARAFDAGGGQTFFKRDLHWTPEGANALSQELARLIQRTVGLLPRAEQTLTRYPQDALHRGQFVSRWLYAHCGYILPDEPLGVYRVSSPAQGGELFGSSAPEVVLAGSSFSLPPFDPGFLGVALQSEVLNASVGAGGAQVALENYLLDGAYEADRPSVLVWEFPTFAPPLPEAAQRQMLASVYGTCAAPTASSEVTFEAVRTVDGAQVMRLAEAAQPRAREHYLELSFDDLSLLRFGVTLTYAGGAEETLKIDRSTLTPNRGRFFLSLADDPQAVLTGVRLELPRGAQGGAVVRLCEVP